MRFVDEYRDAAAVKTILAAIEREATEPCTIMEVCGGQTHSIVKYGLDQLLPKTVELLHGPGCPVCVTAIEVLDRAHAIAERPDVIFCSFGDMLRVPGSHTDLLRIKAKAGDVRIIYSPLEALKIARENPKKEVVLFAVGFETTAPANATAIRLAKLQGLKNFSAIVSHVLVPPALTSILQTPNNRVQAFLGPGHVCAVMGTREYEPISRRYRAPIIVTGFEPLDLLDGVRLAIEQIKAKRAEVQIQYARLVSADGNPAALALLDEVFETCDRKWRGVGSIPKSGFKLRYEYRAFDAERRFDVEALQAEEPTECMSGKVLRGLMKPTECSAFGKACTPSTPLGATMVSSEGACAAYYHYRNADL